MASKRTWRRVNKYGIRNLLLSSYLLIPAIAVIGVIILCPRIFTQVGMGNFVKAATGTSQSLIAVTLSGLAILVSFSDRDFLSHFAEEGGFDELLLIFEYTILLSLITTLSGILLQSLAFEAWVFYIFLFIFLHLLTSAAALVATILRFAKTKSDYDAINNIDDEEIPDELKSDLESIFSKITTDDQRTSLHEDSAGESED